MEIYKLLIILQTITTLVSAVPRKRVEDVYDHRDDDDGHKKATHENDEEMTTAQKVGVGVVGLAGLLSGAALIHATNNQKGPAPIAGIPSPAAPAVPVAPAVPSTSGDGLPWTQRYPRPVVAQALAADSETPPVVVNPTISSTQSEYGDVAALTE